MTENSALEARLEALPRGTVIEVETAGETFHVHRVLGGWHLPYDTTVTSGDICDGQPVRVEVLGDLYGEDPFDERDEWVQRALRDAPPLRPETLARVARLLSEDGRC